MKLHYVNGLYHLLCKHFINSNDLKHLHFVREKKNGNTLSQFFVCLLSRIRGVFPNLIRFKWEPNSYELSNFHIHLFKCSIVWNILLISRGFWMNFFLSNSNPNSKRPIKFDAIIYSASGWTILDVIILGVIFF